MNVLSPHRLDVAYWVQAVSKEGLGVGTRVTSWAEDPLSSCPFILTVTLRLEVRGTVVEPREQFRIAVSVSRLGDKVNFRHTREDRKRLLSRP